MPCTDYPSESAERLFSQEHLHKDVLAIWRVRNDQLARILCAVMESLDRAAETGPVPPLPYEAVQWWIEHKARDAVK